MGLNRFAKVRKISGTRPAWPLAWLLPVFLSAGCGSGVKGSLAGPAAATPGGPQNYFSAAIAGDYNDSANAGSSSQILATYTLDDSKGTFSESTYAFSPTQQGPQLNYSGTFTALPRGLLELNTTYVHGTYGTNICSSADCADMPGSAQGGWAIELAGQAGALIDLNGLPFTPLVAAESCPGSATAQTYQFVTLPAAIVNGNGAEPQLSWNPGLDTAYGSVNISAKGGNVLFSNIEQFTADGTQLRNYSTLGLAPAPVAYTSLSGVCSPTFYGNTISVPGALTITNPGVSQIVGPGAIVGIGSSGLLVESNGNGDAGVSPNFQPFLGAGTGAIGLPKPAAAVSVTDLQAAQFLGFFYSIPNADAWSSTLASFGFSSGTPASCSSVKDQAGTLTNPIFGGDFPGNDATVQGDAGLATYGNCDVSIYLGPQDTASNGLFPKATVTFGSGFASAPGPASFPAVAIAGMLNGRYAIFLIASNGQGIYLFQSN